MENTVEKIALEISNEDAVSSEGIEVRRPRKATLLKLQWLAERIRKVERIKKELAEGTYAVSSEDVARSMLGLKK
ncbi:flagellar biosynthesis anti-sigma factor FlgM [bacterium]|nr:flagellar biosynthesis anti-sigma factor FlgM [bacterium]